MQQKIIFAVEGVEVNATQLIANNHLFSLRELKSVKHGIVEPKRGFSYFCVLAGSLLLNLETAFMLVGGFSIVLGMIAFFSTKTLYTVVVETAHEQHQAFASESSEAADSVIRAINTAIINRG
jgi:hypothetical protein